MKFQITFLLLVTLLTSCLQKQDQQQEVSSEVLNMNPNIHTVIVKEVIQSTSYTYMLVSEDVLDYWIAVNRQEASPGEQYVFEESLEMTNFKSKDLNREFEKILFVQNIVNANHAEQQLNNKSVHDHSGRKITNLKEDINIDKKSGELSINELFQNSSTYADKVITIKGQVTKVNNSIMDKNWIHIQDGTSFNDNFDLTITSDETAEIGDIITITGKVTLNKDFGAGYFYNLLIENASIISSKSQV